MKVFVGSDIVISSLILVRKYLEWVDLSDLSDRVNMTIRYSGECKLVTVDPKLLEVKEWCVKISKA